MSSHPEPRNENALPLTADEVLSRVTEAVVVVDRDWRIVYANPEACRINNKAASEFVGKIHWEEWPGAIGTVFEQELCRSMQEQRPAQFRALYNHPPYHVWLDVRAYPSPDRLTLFYRDVTGEYQAEQELATIQSQLRDQVEEYRKLFEMLPVCLAVGYDAECRVIHPNPELSKLLRVDPSVNTSASLPEAKTFPFRWMRGDRVLSAEELPQQVCCRTGRPVMNVELELVFDDGERHALFGHAVPLFDEAGAVRGSVGAYLDVTTQRQAEEMLRRSDAVASAGRLAHAVAHEINNPLQAAVGLIYMINAAPELPPDLRANATEALEQLGRIGNLVRQTLGLFRDMKELFLEPAPMPLESLVNEALRHYTKSAVLKGVSIEAELGSASSLLVPANLSDAFSNPIRNSIEACERGQKVRVKAEFSGEELRITIQDTGSGIPAEIQSKVFEPLFTTKPGTGIGLGLWVTRRIVERYGGSVQLQSRTAAPSGTIVEIRLPIAAVTMRL
ncbi:MAG TPA: ATP-binding protein [Terriglobales bacterium]